MLTRVMTVGKGLLFWTCRDLVSNVKQGNQMTGGSRNADVGADKPCNCKSCQNRQSEEQPTFNRRVS